MLVVEEEPSSYHPICLLVKMWLGSTSRQYWLIFARLIPEVQFPDSRCRQTPVRLVNLLVHQGHLTFFPTCTDDLRCLWRSRLLQRSSVESGEYLVEVVQILERSLAAVAVVWGMLFVNVFLEPIFGAENRVTVLTLMPVIFLLVFQAKLALVGWPSGEAPAAFNLV